MDTIDAVLGKTMDPTLMPEIKKCNWDNEKMILSTPDDAENDKKTKMEETAWYVDIFSDGDMETVAKRRRLHSPAKRLWTSFIATTRSNSFIRKRHFRQLIQWRHFPRRQ